MLCDQQSHGHVIGGCETELIESRYNWQHDFILLNIYKTIKSQRLQAFVDIEGYPTRIHESLLAVSNNQYGIVKATTYSLCVIKNGEIQNF